MPDHQMHRLWINQPSTLQPFHQHNGRKVLVDVSNPDQWRAFFPEGDLPPIDIDREALSPGWPVNGRVAYDDVRFSPLNKTIDHGPGHDNNGRSRDNGPRFVQNVNYQPRTKPSSYRQNA